MIASSALVSLSSFFLFPSLFPFLFFSSFSPLFFSGAEPYSTKKLPAPATFSCWRALPRRSHGRSHVILIPTSGIA